MCTEKLSLEQLHDKLPIRWFVVFSPDDSCDLAPDHVHP